MLLDMVGFEGGKDSTVSTNGLSDSEIEEMGVVRQKDRSPTQTLYTSALSFLAQGKNNGCEPGALPRTDMNVR
jgi:hypothetical protein